MSAAAETGGELWRRLVPAPGGPGDETWGDVPYEDRVCRLTPGTPDDTDSTQTSPLTAVA